MKIRAIITGATGMVGEGVLHECLQSQHVEAVLVVGRRSCGMTHPKLTEIVHSDFFDIASIADSFKGYNACYFCLGVSSVGMKEDDYNKMTYVLTTGFADALVKVSPDLVFCYVSGKSTDSTEQGRSMWARVKGRTENYLLALPFKKAYMFRPGYMHPTPGLKNTLGLYKYMGWMFPILKLLAPGSASTLAELGQAMINVTRQGYDKKILEVPDIVKLAASK